MSQMVKHAVILGLSLPTALVGYHLILGGPVGEGTAEASTLGLVELEGDFTVRGSYDFQELEILARNMLYVESRYVEKERLDSEAMFQSALDMVEQNINEVMFVRVPRGRMLQVSVGSTSTMLQLAPIDSMSVMKDELRRVAAVLDQNLSDEINRAEVEWGMINGALSTLDPHSILLPPVAAKEMDVDNQGEFGGLGIEITVREGRLTVKSPLEGTPAWNAGLKSDDHIIRIEDESTINMDLQDAVSKLRGPVGTTVNIMVDRKQFPSPRPFAITRAKIRINMVDGELLDGNVGYIRIKSFHANVSTELEELLSRFKREAGSEGMRGLILDMRGNPGGYLNQAVEVADRFLDDGVIVSTVEGDGMRGEEQRASRAATESDYPIVVLVNGSSASASEIVAGALKNHQRAIVVGERTFGKGSVQHLISNRDESKLKLTVAKYLTPGDKDIQSVGIPADILLRPSIVRAPDEEDEDPNPSISLYWREWIDREADLDHHLENEPQVEHDAVYEVRYLRPDLGDDVDPGPRTDWEIGFARDVLLATSSERRPETLKAAGHVVQTHQEVQASAINKAFDKLGLDWRDGENPKWPQLDVRLDLGEDGVLRAGEPEDVAIEVTNIGESPVYQVSAITDSENPFLSRREYFFGYIEPGQTRRYVQRIYPHEGLSSTMSPVTLKFRGAGGMEIEKQTGLVKSLSKGLPAFAYSVRLFDDGSGNSKGDGDGLPEVGEVIDLELTVHNTGEGSASGGFARIKNRSGRTLDLQAGSFQLGTVLPKDGEPCDPDNTVCERDLAAGTSDTGRLTFELRELPEAGFWDLDVQVGDNESFDFSAIQMGGFYDYFQSTEHLVLRPDTPLEERQRNPPAIEISRSAPLESRESDLVLSGVVRDSRGLRDVMVFQDEDKIFYRGGEDGARTMPFSVEPQLEDGLNRVFILVRDDEGLTATRSVEVWRHATSTLEK